MSLYVDPEWSSLWDCGLVVFLKASDPEFIVTKIQNSRSLSEDIKTRMGEI